MEERIGTDNDGDDTRAKINRKDKRKTTEKDR